MIHSLLFAVQVFINGQAIEAIELNGKLYVPVEAVKALGAEVTVPKPGPVEAAVSASPAAAPETGAPPTARPWKEPVPPASVTAIRGKLTWKDNMYRSPPDAGAQAWLVPASEVAGLARAAGGTLDEPIPTRATDWPAKLDAEFKFPKSVADDQGRYGFDNVAPGEYLLILVSKRSNSLAARDRQGKMRFKKIVARPGETVDASFNFGVTAYR